MILHILETQKALNKAFLKNKANRELLECFKVNLIQFLNSNNEKETERFSKKHAQDFIKKAAYDLNYSLNTSGRNASMTSIAETPSCPSLRVEQSGAWQSVERGNLLMLRYSSSRYPCRVSPKLKHWGTIWVEPLVLARGGESQLFISQS